MSYTLTHDYLCIC